MWCLRTISSSQKYGFHHHPSARPVCRPRAVEGLTPASQHQLPTPTPADASSSRPAYKLLYGKRCRVRIHR
jgi:hypothetical protein